MQESLDGLDWQVLEVLQTRGRISVSELAEHLNRSRITIKDRIDKLNRLEVIEQHSIKVNELKLGVGLIAFVRLEASSESHRTIINDILKLPEVAECHVLTGSDLLLMRMVARNMPHLRTLVDRLTQYGSTQTDIVFSTLKSELQINPSLRTVLNQSSD